jgi:hypothetical protein
MVARLQLTPTFLSRATLWSEGPSRRRDHDCGSSAACRRSPTLILGRRCGRKDRVADDATVVARL